MVSLRIVLPALYRMRRLAILLPAVLCVAAPVANGQSATSYRPTTSVSGTLRIWGHGNRHQQYIGALLRAWEQDFNKLQPGVKFENGMTGNASAIGGLFTGAADISFMDREIWATELDAFQQGTGHDPYSVAVATGSLAVPNQGPALVIFVNRSNPLRKLTLAQLDAIYGADHRRGAENIRTWGQLGLTGEWAARPIHPYGYGILRRQSQYFEHRVMKGSQKWNCGLQEFSDRIEGDGSIARASQQIQEALARDPDGIAFATLEFRNPGIRMVALAAEDSVAAVDASAATIASRAYPLVQTLYAYADRAPGKALDPKVREFLSYILSRQGQEILAREQGYLPLPQEMDQQQEGKLQ